MRLRQNLVRRLGSRKLDLGGWRTRRLRERATATPNQVGSQDRAIEYITFYDRDIVVGCACQYGDHLAEFEKMVLRYGKAIANYLNGVSARAAQTAIDLNIESSNLR